MKISKNFMKYFSQDSPKLNNVFFVVVVVVTILPFTLVSFLKVMVYTWIILCVCLLVVAGQQRQSLRLLPMGVLESMDLRNQIVKVPDTDGNSIVH